MGWIFVVWGVIAVVLLGLMLYWES